MALKNEEKPINRPEIIEMAVSRGTGEELPFYCVSSMKLSIMSIATFGLYQIFWFYKNWVLVKEKSGSNIRPFWRAVFSIFYCYPFATAVNAAAESVRISSRIAAGPIAVIYAGFLLTERLPDPYWQIGLLSFVPLIPIAQQVRKVHEAIRPGFESEIGWNGWSYLTLVIGGIFVGLVVITNFTPPTRALRHPEIPTSYQVALVEAGVVEPEERIQFFYSAGFLSILEDGNLLTEKRVISYETVDEELYVASSFYSEIRDFDVAYSDGFFDDTIITVSTMSGDEIMLFVSSEDGRDREFVSYLESRLSRRQ